VLSTDVILALILFNTLCRL